MEATNKLRSLKVYWAVLGATLLAVILLNRWLDVSGLTTTAEVYRLAEQQAPADLLVWENLFDQRSWVKARLERKECPEILVMGSSTVGGLRAEWFGGQRFLNGWLGGPTIEDFEALTSILERSGCTPRQLILGVDHWLLNAKVQDRRWVSIASDYVAYQQRHGSTLSAIQAPLRYWDLLKERLNFVTTMESARRLVALLQQGKLPSRPRLSHATPEEFCKTISSEYYIRSADGHFTTCPVFASSRERVEQVARDYVSQNGHQVKEWTHVDGARLQRLTLLLRLLHEKGAQVTLLAEPFHPVAYQSLMNDARIHENLQMMDDELTKLARSLSGHYLNLRNPDLVGCSREEFEDSHHAQPSCLAKVAAKVVETIRAP